MKRAKPAETTTFAVKISREELEKVRAAARAEDRNVSQWVRTVIRRELAKMEAAA